MKPAATKRRAPAKASAPRAPETVRDRIVAAGATILAEGGREALTTRAVASAAGIQAPTIYRLFGDKDGLLYAVAEDRLAKYVAQKGSICVDGVSLTVNAVDHCGFEVALIPHTIAHTAFSQARVGAAVNLEIDLVARYVERLLAAGTDPADAGSMGAASTGEDA